MNKLSRFCIMVMFNALMAFVVAIYFNLNANIDPTGPNILRSIFYVFAGLFIFAEDIEKWIKL